MWNSALFWEWQSLEQNYWGSHAVSINSQYQGPICITLISSCGLSNPIELGRSINSTRWKTFYEGYSKHTRRYNEHICNEALRKIKDNVLATVGKCLQVILLLPCLRRLKKQYMRKSISIQKSSSSMSERFDTVTKINLDILSKLARERTEYLSVHTVMGSEQSNPTDFLNSLELSASIEIRRFSHAFSKFRCLEIIYWTLCHTTWTAYNKRHYLIAILNNSQAVKDR